MIKDKIILSPSRLTAYIAYDNGVEYFTKEKVIDSILRNTDDDSLFRMNIGRECHRFLEIGSANINKKQVTGLSSFRNKLVETKGAFELFCFHKFNNFSMQGIIDHTTHHYIDEFKFIFNYSPDFDIYRKSIQWQFYCLCSGIKTAQYHVFSVGKSGKSLLEKGSVFFNVWEVGGFEEIKNRIQDYGNKFIEFCYQNNLEHQIIKKQI